MTTNFFTQSQTIAVSRFDANGWWAGNTTEHVAKHTALSKNATMHIYAPSAAGLTAKYDKDADVWSDEITDATQLLRFNQHGARIVVTAPDAEYPDDAIADAPPAHDATTQTVLYKDRSWKTYDILVGQKYYDRTGQAFLIADYNFELPDDCTLEAPPAAPDGFAVQLSHGAWVVLADHRQKMAYAKDRIMSDYVITELGDIENSHTLNAPGLYESWDDTAQAWAYDIERHRPFKAKEERDWCDAMLQQVLNRIDQHDRDQNIAAELRVSALTQDEYGALFYDRKALCDYPASTDFPFGGRPDLTITTLGDTQ